MDLSRREMIKYGGLGVLGAVSAARTAENRYEVSEMVTKRLVSDQEFALQQIQELDNSYQEALQGDGNLMDATELLFLFLGNPNHYEKYSREGFVPDTEGLLEENGEEQVFKNYAEKGVEEIPFSSTQASILLDQELDIDVVYLNQGEDTKLVSEGVNTVESEVGNIVPSDFDFSVDSRILEADAEIEEALKEISESMDDSLHKLNKAVGYDTDSSLPVYIFRPRELDRLSGLLMADSSEMWGGFGTPEGAAVAMPSKILQIGEKDFYSTLVHEIGHSAFELPHSAVRDDTMTYNFEAGGNSTSFTTSELLIQSYLDSDLKVRAEEKYGVEGVYFQQIPGKIPREEAVDAFFANLNAYITDMVDEFDLDPKKFENTSYKRKDGLDIARYQDYDGTGVDMEITADQLIRDIEGIK